MKKSAFILFIVIVSLALATLIGMQVYWIQNAVRLREGNFQRSVDEAVNAAVLKLEYIELSRHITQGEGIIKQESDSSLFYYQKRLVPGTGNEEADKAGSISDANDTLVNGANLITIDPRRNEPAPPPKHIGNNEPSPRHSALGMQELLRPGPEWSQPSIIHRMFSQLVGPAGVREIENYLSVGLIDTLLTSELAVKGIPIDFEFGVYNTYRNKIVLEKTGRYHDILLGRSFTFPVFGSAGVSPTNYLLVYFPDQSRFILMNLWGLLTISAGLLFIIVMAFAYSMFTIIRQRKLSELKNDFINNMTHEFKTPISTVSLACQALTDNDIPHTPELYNNYINIISEENRRLGQMAEKILQTAILEQGKLNLRFEKINLHTLIHDVIKNIGIQVEIRDGSIATELLADDPYLKADKVHLSNMMYNLLDNANKYSPRRPTILITTENAENGVILKVKDNGIGISKANQKKIFEKLYRVPTGDVHNVKGFGLGLSYVKFVVEKHGGTISVDSEINKGSTFSIYLPGNLMNTNASDKVK
ncbi:MAG TPA: HAMP domain-containing sensor histidine kinase [Bacteroidales bacterium]|nr:HAMP domain-containing sensor histidine kinase [Bacteroidales bacterium]HPT01270.1 HAMP domain-containing sensor histidine kinase [Bacteroidales bacterium]